MKTVGDLAAYFEREGISPELLSKKVNISNMTLRRLLKKNHRSLLPEKYRRLLSLEIDAGGEKRLGDPPSESVLKDFGILFSEIEDAGRQRMDEEGLDSDVAKKLSVAKLGRAFKEMAMVLLRQATGNGSIRNRALAVGALVYFINPFDAIPDALPGIGYLDDFAVMTLVVGLVTNTALSKRRRSIAG